MDALSRKALWALHELYVNSVPGKNGPPRKGGGGGRSGTPGAARGASQGPMANQPEVCVCVCVHQLAMRVVILFTCA